MHGGKVKSFKVRVMVCNPTFKSFKKLLKN